ncbi:MULTISPECIES: hypothetical protein [Paracoccus]|uniref:Uncharacterized protein n=1 Tax=Paracoccus fontiphilus TaxID=1815556 RepID=A0ABV7IIP5_9RHOB|nr:hypothetical protein [Paracoccus fontiphilus]
MERIVRSHECLAMAIVPLLPVGTRDWKDCIAAWSFLLPTTASARRVTAEESFYYIQFPKIVGPVWFSGPWQISDPEFDGAIWCGYGNKRYGQGLEPCRRLQVAESLGPLQRG